ncbi:TonB-dependent receptor [Stagnimonas aquatica]|uniref:TonB-dependent receptor n=1 Tax=Stagnimonas aquatica TaxID=2689987 RepID=A0A3N0VLK6_9GAMM|nr:TonB-dependent receptor [Stagnimonas aquatica]ROH93629.1 TonB-dependent receptor [Stagnimonas aquatica]
MTRQLLCLGLLFASLEVSAQEAATSEALPTLEVQALPEPERPAAAAEAAQNPAALDTVVVTARRKKEKVEVVPISMTVLDGGKLAEAGLFRPQDIQERVPGLVVSVPNPRLTSYTIRGLGSSSANDGLESSVGLFLDGVYLGRQGLSVFDLVDLDRVEVLRGPQGTLFGKNTTAGAFNIVTKAPTPEFEARAEATRGNYGARQYRGSLNGGLIGETLSGRLTGYLTRRDGLIENRYDGRDFNDQRKGGVRGQLLWAPVENFSSRLIYEYADAHEDCCAFALTSLREATRQRDAYMEYQREAIAPYARVVQDDSQIASVVRQKAVSNEINWTLDNGLTLTSISAWRDWRFTPYNDDATTMRLIPLTGVINEHQQLSQELRATFKAGDFDFLGGLYYLRQELDSRERNVLGRDLIPWVFGGIIRQNLLPGATRSNSGFLIDLIAPGANVEGTTIRSTAEQTTDSAALFGSVDWHLTPQFDASLGLRYTHENKEATVSRSRSALNTGGDPSQPLELPGALLGVLGLQDPRNLLLDVVLDQIAGGDYARASQRSEGELSGQLALGYQWRPNVRGYFTLARGYKGGGINLGVIGPSVGETFEPETATSVELGVKSSFLRRRLGLNAAVYHTAVRDYQALTFDNEQTLIPNPRQVNVLNVGKVRLQGAELEGRARLWSSLGLRAGIAYSRAVTLDFTNAPNEDDRANTKDLSGQRLYNAPILTATAGIEQALPLSAALALYSGLDYSYRSDYYGTVEHGRGSKTEAYSLTNLRLGLRHARGLDVSVWVRNLFDEDYLAAINPIYGVGEYGAIPGDPRTVGVSLRANFE